MPPDNYPSIKNYCLFYLFVCIFIGLLLVYYIFGTYTLVDDYSKFEDAVSICDTKVWYYVFISMVINVDKVFFRRYYYINDNVRFFVSVTLIEIMMVIFGGIELSRNDKCLKENYNEFFYTNLWRFALANFIMQLFIGSVLTIKLLNYLCEKKNQTLPIDNTNNNTNTNNTNNTNNNYYNINQDSEPEGTYNTNEISNLENHSYLEDINIDTRRNNINGIQCESIV